MLEAQNVYIETHPLQSPRVCFTTITACPTNTKQRY